MPFPNFEKLLPAVSLAGMTEQEKQAERARYMDRVRQVTLDYVSGLSKTEDIYHRATFQGLLKRIFVQCGRPDYEDLPLMTELENYYTDLCATYQQTITLEKYCIMIGCSRDYYNIWIEEAKKHGLRGHIFIDNFLRNEVISALQEGALSGNPGYMFVLKARHGWSDQPAPGGSQTEQAGPSLEQLAASLGIQTQDAAGAEPLPLPDQAGILDTE